MSTPLDHIDTVETYWLTDGTVGVVVNGERVKLSPKEAHEFIGHLEAAIQSAERAR